VFSGIVASAARSRDLATRSFALPIDARLTDDDVDRVIETIRAFFGS
jgi:dTDP-4-amino-4,6-dideoxygalactose transaminase